MASRRQRFCNEPVEPACLALQRAGTCDNGALTLSYLHSMRHSFCRPLTLRGNPLPLLLPPVSHDELFIRTLPSPAPPLAWFIFLCIARFSFSFAVTGTDTRYCLVLLSFFIGRSCSSYTWYSVPSGPLSNIAGLDIIYCICFFIDSTFFHHEDHVFGLSPSLPGYGSGHWLGKYRLHYLYDNTHGVLSANCHLQWWGSDECYTAPDTINNECTEEQQAGFNWESLDIGDFSSYGGLDFSGFACSSGFGGLRTRTFNVSGTSSLQDLHARIPIFSRINVLPERLARHRLRRPHRARLSPAAKVNLGSQSINSISSPP